jgi:hypothetical protein
LEDIRKKNLQIQLEKFVISIDDQQRKFYYLRTIENMIFHFDEIKNENDKNWIYEMLIEYLDKSFELMPQMSIKNSKHLYETYLDKVINYYHDHHLKFSMIVFSNFLLLFYLIILAVCSYFFQLWVPLLLGTLFLIQPLNSIKKYRNKRFYEVPR